MKINIKNFTLLYFIVTAKREKKISQEIHLFGYLTSCLSLKKNVSRDFQHTFFLHFFLR